MKTSAALVLALILVSVMPACDRAENTQSTQDTVAAVLALPDRTDADRERDARGKPAAVLELLALKPGQTVIDVFAGGGYYSELMAYLVGSEGQVLLHNNQAYRNFVGPALTERMQRLSLPQLQQYDREVSDLGLSAESLDAAIIIMSYHDLYHADPDNGWPAIDSKNFLGQLHAALKPGGKFLIVDHAAQPGSGNQAAQDLHRITEDFAIQDIQSHGFKLAGSSDALRNPEDNKDIMVFDEAVRGKTDRFILLFEKI